MNVARAIFGPVHIPSEDEYVPKRRHSHNKPPFFKNGLGCVSLGTVLMVSGVTINPKKLEFLYPPKPQPSEQVQEALDFSYTFRQINPLSITDEFNSQLESILKNQPTVTPELQLEIRDFQLQSAHYNSKVLNISSSLHTVLFLTGLGLAVYGAKKMTEE